MLKTNRRLLMQAFCPYRICPLGAHVDHQLGLVTGFAIDKGIHLEYEPTEDGSVVVYSENFPGKIEFNVNDELFEKETDWGDYFKGAVESLKRFYDITKGINGSIRGDLPIGGLSSSAAVIITYIVTIARVNDIQLERSEIIKLALWVETDFIGIKVGKLDQSCEVLCKKDQLLFLDTSNDKHKYIEKSSAMKPFKIAIIFSGVERNLANSSYNLRVDECKAAAYALEGYANMQYCKFNDTYLRTVPREIFEMHKDKLPRNWYKRAEHFYEENDRVKKGIRAWKNGDLEEFGRLIFESGHSSIYNYEAGSEELIAVYDIMRETEGIYGGRFSGAGFKGCCMALVDPDKIEAIETNIREKYLEKFPYLANKFEICFCDTSNGVEL